MSMRWVPSGSRLHWQWATWLLAGAVGSTLWLAACSSSDSASGGAAASNGGSSGAAGRPELGGTNGGGSSGAADSGLGGSLLGGAAGEPGGGVAGAAGLAGSAGAGGARTTGRDYYCDPVRGLPTNPGTAESPWRRLEELFSAGKTFTDGDIIHLRSGNHGAPVIKGALGSGSRTIEAEPGQSPVMKTLRFAAGATHWVVDGVLVSPQEADGSLTTATLVQFDDGATNNVFQNSQLRYAPDSIASTWNNAAWLANSGTAIEVIGRDNQIIGNQIRNTHVGVMVDRTPTGGATGTLVRGNSMNHFWEDAYRGKIGDCTFEYNSAVNSYAVVPAGTEGDPPHRDMFQSYSGVASLPPIDNVVLRGNVFIARQGTRYSAVPFQYNGHYTIQGISAFDGPYRNWTIENNVVMVEVGLAMSLYGMSSSKILNNTVVPDSFGTDSELRVFNQKDGTPPNDNIIRNNLAHTLNFAPEVKVAQSNNLAVSSADYTTFFVNYAAGDLHLKAGSPAINAGTSTDAPSIDADRAPRQAPFDVGAYEFGAAAP